MSSDWNGKRLQEIYTEDAGFSDSDSLSRTLRYLNEIQSDICSSSSWANLKFRMKKFITSGSQKIDVSPQIPSAPIISLGSGGSLSEGVDCSVKVTFILFDETEQEINSIESQASDSSNVIKPTGENLKILVNNIPSYEGDYEKQPVMIHRRIYLKQGSSPFRLVATIKENDSNQVWIDTNPTSSIEPPEESMIENLASEDVAFHAGSVVLYEEKLDEIQKYDPAMTARGIPRYYARISDTQILLYPIPISDMTLSYWVKRRPSRIFAEENRPIQMSRSLENVLDVGVNYKWMKHKQDSDWTTMYNLYKDLRSEAKAEKVKRGGQSLRVKVVC